MINSLARIFSFGAILALGGTTLLQAQQATFHLPVEAHWGTAVLQPGDYKMLFPDRAAGFQQFRIQGADKNVFVFPKMTDAKETTDSSYLKLKEINGEYFITEFSSGTAGKDFTFYAPKPVRQLEASRNTPKGTGTVSVVVN